MKTSEQITVHMHMSESENKDPKQEKDDVERACPQKVLSRTLRECRKGVECDLVSLV